MNPLLANLDDPVAVLDEIMRRDFTFFVDKAFEEIEGGGPLDHNWHIDAVGKCLEDVRLGHCRRLIVTMPPRNLKSIMISVAWVAHMLGRDPTLNFVCVSYSNELALDLARKCRAIMESAWYKRLFPGTVLSKRTAIHDFQTTRGGGRLATSVTGTLTGRGGDIIIIDDPIKPDEAMSETVRAFVNNWYRSTLSSRLNDKRTGTIITVMQRLHEEDLAGVMLEEGGWIHLNLPAIATEETVIPLTRGRTYLRQEGEALHASREPVPVLEGIKRQQGSVIFSAQYQQQPVPAEGALIEAAWLQRYDGPVEIMPGDRVVQSWDTASKDGVHNDWSVCVTAILRRQTIYVIDVYRARLTFPELMKMVIAKGREHRLNALLIEDAASGQQLYQMLLSNPPPGVPTPLAMKAELDKVTRLSGVSAMIEAGQVLLPHDASWLGAFEHELLAFPNGKHDDQVDALSQLLTWAHIQNRFVSGSVGFGDSYTGHPNGPTYKNGVLLDEFDDEEDRSEDEEDRSDDEDDAHLW